ncbi:hypothetical protein KFL_004300130 [Klebsormidium nitens]|uniref:Thioredoxin domain-containing protein n=1 Tax=Klebsormidium nitens TaxID=105231 RepID=A0A1Y1IEQ7_KLENI|nr:hypothetical protein KFL_004300130 [Klebsormidium nitens]|eukprot:GAQ88462.1 hypothetical protein KFL_004300130 [Klebsormidium nitens]
MTMPEKVILSPEDPLAWLQKQISSRPLTGLLFEKGPWCPWCVHEVKQWMGQLQRLQGLGGALLIVTAQSQEKLVDSPADWGRPEVPVISDPINILATEMGIAVEKRAMLPSLQPIYEAYKDGVNQVGFVFFNQSGEEVVGWGATPTENNLGGSLDRPVPAQVMDFLERKLLQPRPQPRGHDLNNKVKLTIQVKAKPIVEEAEPDFAAIELDDYAQVVEDVFDALPQDLQALVLKEKRLPQSSRRLTAEM